MVVPLYDLLMAEDPDGPGESCSGDRDQGLPWAKFAPQVVTTSSGVDVLFSP